MDKILIINDERAKNENLWSALSGLPYDIISTQSTEEGLEYFHQINPFLIIMDCKQDSERGLEFIIDLIKQELPKQPNLSHYSSPPANPEYNSLTLRTVNFYVIILAETLSKSLQQKYRNLGVDYLLTKPIHLYTFQGIINTIHRLKATRDELYEKFSTI